MDKMRNKLRIYGKGIAVFAMTLVFFTATWSLHALTISEDFPFGIYTESFTFPAEVGSVSFKLVSLPEVTQTDYNDEGYLGSTLFATWQGVRATGHSISLRHTGRVNEVSDTFATSIFTQAMCIGDQAGPPKDDEFTAEFVKPVLVTDPAEQELFTTVRSYDDVQISWGNGQFRVAIQRYWRKIEIPQGIEPEDLTPNDYYIILNEQNPPENDVPSSSAPVVFTTSYPGRFAPSTTRVNIGSPMKRDEYIAPAMMALDGEKNIDLLFYDIVLNVDGPGRTPEQKVCNKDNEPIPPEPLQPCGCLNDNNLKTCGDPEVDYEDLWPPVDAGAGGTDWAIEDMGEMSDAVSRGSEQAGFDPEVFINNVSVNPAFGDMITVSALPRAFTSMPEESYYGWCVDGKTQQGLLAGGEEIVLTVESAGTKDADERGCCDLASREPKVDQDPADGIDDEWQERYHYKAFGTPGKLAADYDEDGPGADVTEDGQTNDGYEANSYLDILGERIAVAPGSVSFNGQNFVTGDGEFTAAEEYIWGTDPTEYDTDQDGYSDEADVVGAGQTTLEFTSQKKPRDYPEDDEELGGDRYRIDVQAIGRIKSQRDANAQQSGDEDEDINLEEVVRIGKDSHWLYARDEGDISASISHTPEGPGLFEPVRLDTKIIESARSLGTMYYTYFAQRLPALQNEGTPGGPDGSESFAEGPGVQIIDLDSIFEICPECQPGDQLIVVVEAIDEVSGELSVASTTINIGTDNSLYVYQDCNEDGADEQVGAPYPEYCFRSNQVTSNIPVRVSLEMFNEDAEDYYYEWYLDFIPQSENCLKPGKTTHDQPERCGEGTSQMLFTPDERGTKHELRVSVYKNDPDNPEDQYNPVGNSEVVAVSSLLEVGNPAVTIEIDEPALAGTRNGYALGSTVTARAHVEFLDPNPEGQLPDGEESAIEYIWSIGDNEILTETRNDVDQSTVELDATGVGTLTINVSVQSPDLHTFTDESQLITLSDSLPYYIIDQGEGAQNSRVGTVLASIKEAFPQAFRAIASFVSLLLVVAAAMWGIMRSMRPRETMK